eukprot:GHVT01097778.1.p1 GENE.GHVT01097778.1~~GHVT01097778.1.p1  ORF type:complete len:261 (-),score=46.15 GHVT01097778.1:46-828(-)
MRKNNCKLLIEIGRVVNRLPGSSKESKLTRISLTRCVCAFVRRSLDPQRPCSFLRFLKAVGWKGLTVKSDTREKMTAPFDKENDEGGITCAALAENNCTPAAEVSSGVRPTSAEACLLPVSRHTPFVESLFASRFAHLTAPSASLVKAVLPEVLAHGDGRLITGLILTDILRRQQPHKAPAFIPAFEEYAALWASAKEHARRPNSNSPHTSDTSAAATLGADDYFPSRHLVRHTKRDKADNGAGQPAMVPYRLCTQIKHF